VPPGRPAFAATVSLDLSTARLELGPKAKAALEFADGTKRIKLYY
jgi:hypothetical protein